MSSFTHIQKPQISFSDAIYALRCYFLSGSQKSTFVPKLEHAMRIKTGAADALAFNAARSALYAALTVLGIGKGDEVLVPAYTFVSVPNSVLWVGATPIYVDIDPLLYNESYSELERLISKKTKAIIVQHTLGLPMEMDKIMRLAHQHHLFVIEDVAHALGATYKKRSVGMWGDMGIFSFGSSKIIDASSGGVLVTKRKDLGEKLRAYQKQLPLPPSSWTRGQLLFLLTNYFLKPYGLGMGEKLYGYLREKKIIPRMLLPKEREGEQPSIYPSRMPDAHAALALHQLPNLSAMNRKRQKIAERYTKMLKDVQVGLPSLTADRVYLGFPIQSIHATLIGKALALRGLPTTDMFGECIGPRGINLQKIKYRKGQCPNAEHVAATCVELPVGRHVTDQDVLKIVSIIKGVLKDVTERNSHSQ